MDAIASAAYAEQLLPHGKAAVCFKKLFQKIVEKIFNFRGKRIFKNSLKKNNFFKEIKVKT